VEANYIQGVSIPRSGHHLLVRLLVDYFNEVLDEGEASPSGIFSYCEFYHCCRNNPCPKFDSTRPGTVLLQKSHDEFLRQINKRYEHPKLVLESQRYLIQIRHPIDSLLSDYELAKANSLKPLSQREGWTFVKLKYKGNPGVDWDNFLINQLEYRIAFLKKWVLENPHISLGTSLVLDYDDFLSSPKSRFAQVLKFLSPEHNVDESRLDPLMARNPLKTKNHRVLPELSDSQSALVDETEEVWEEVRSALID